jgi:hypothetical protein
MKYFLFTILFILSGCGPISSVGDEDNYAQYLLDNKEYLAVIDYLSSEPTTTSNRKILADAYIGASGFELLPFLIQLKAIPKHISKEEEHLFEYLKIVLSSFEIFTKVKLEYLEQALKLLIISNDPNTEKTQSKFKMGLVYLYKVFGSLKDVGQYAKKIRIDPENGKVVILTSEEKADLLRNSNNILEFSLKAYVNLRSSYSYLKNYFKAIDLNLKELIGVTIDEIEGRLETTPSDELLNEILQNNPRIRVKIYKFINSECDKKLIRTSLIAVKKMIRRAPQLQDLNEMIEILISKLDLYSAKECREEIY